MARNIRNITQTTYDVTAVVVTEDGVKTYQVPFSTKSEPTIIRALAEKFGVAKSRVAVVSIEDVKRTVKILDLQGAIDAGFAVVVEDEDEDEDEN